MKAIIKFFEDIIANRGVLFALSINDVKAKFSASILGVFWAFLQPLATILVLWFVFEKGLKSQPVLNAPFIVWLIPSYLVWSFMLEAILGTANCIIEYKYLVKKVNFRVSMIPLVKIISAIFIHLFFVVFIMCINGIYGIGVSIYNLQVIYYLICAIIFIAGLGWLLSAMVPFVADVYSITTVVLQVGFWATPIVWNVEEMSPLVQTILKLNPFYYICQGYRDSFVLKVWFWEKGWVNIYFWSVTALILWLGIVTFKKMRPQFADVL